MRSKRKMWRNGRGGQWTARITWYEGADIRLMEDHPEGVINKIYPLNQRIQAEVEWQVFREKWGCPPDFKHEVPPPKSP